jgi:hypothetical protein
MIDKKEVRKIKTDEIEGEYILKNTGPDKKAIKSYMVPDKKKIIFSTVVWYDPETGKYYFKSESDMGGNTLSGQIVSHKLIQDLLSISKWMLKPIGELWDDGKRTHSGGVDIDGDGVKMKNAPYRWSAEAEADLRRALESQDDQKKDDDGPKYAGAPYNREEDEEAIRKALKRQDELKKAEPKQKGWLKGTPAQRAEHAKKLATIKREGCCPKCHRRITPEHQKIFDEHYVCEWCYQKIITNCKEDEYSDFAKEDSK